ncbi:uncharacterized protein LOC131314086 [Rhododendron vialii]|uniref:uncharacterized protein LOC131314086 n=1 Tax=Rhododendron vialii TaxID=182163 RepID=UPI00265E2B90|nr:uncharacterized protein LOC131314086 [Rhododendron vialii]
MDYTNIGLRHGYLIIFEEIQTLCSWLNLEPPPMQQNSLYVMSPLGYISPTNKSCDRIFSVKSAYGQWELQNHSSSALLGSLWKNLAPPKVVIFAWVAVKERVATRSVLLSRNLINEIQLALCPLCSLHLETHQHLFLHCHFSLNVWSIILDWWNIKWVCPIFVPELANWWFTNGFYNLEKHVWKACFYATLWSIWLVRNDTIFNNSTKQAWEVGDSVKTRVAMWMKVKYDIKVYIVEEFKIFLDGVRKLRL